jgi:hypothetical protein
MSIKKNLFAFAALAALVVAPNAAKAVAGDEAQLKILNTSPVWADSAQSYHSCNVVNVTTLAATVTVDLLNSGGVLVRTATVAIPAGDSIELSNGATYSGFARCRFTVADPAWIRANITVFHWTGTYYATLAIDDAR